MKQQEINYKKYSKIHSQKRNANMEVLRVLAMFLIVAGHYVWTGVKQVAPPNVLNVNECLMGGKLCQHGIALGNCLHRC